MSIAKLRQGDKAPLGATCRPSQPREPNMPLLTKKDSIERSAPRMLECKQDVTARSLNAIGRWTSPVELRGRGLCGLLWVGLGWLQTLRRGGFDGELDLTAPKGG